MTRVGSSSSCSSAGRSGRRCSASLIAWGLPRPRDRCAAEHLRRSGARGVAITRMTPGVRIAAIAASGLAALPLGSFGPGLVAGNSVFVGGHFALGFVVGVPATAFVASAGGTIAIGLLVLLALLEVSAWFVVRRTAALCDPSDVRRLGDAACPACLTLAMMSRPEECCHQPLKTSRPPPLCGAAMMPLMVELDSRAARILVVDDEHAPGRIRPACPRVRGPPCGCRPRRRRRTRRDAGFDARPRRARSHAARGFDGLEVCRRLRRRGGRPILILTARDVEADIGAKWLRPAAPMTT